jgi:preprotein translocase subunit SecB
MSESATSQQPVFSLEKIYLKDTSYEAPGAPAVFLDNSQPEVGIRIGLAHRAIDAAQGFHDVVLTVEVNAKAKDKSLFLVEVQQGGVFRVQGVNGDVLQHTLEVTCPYVLLPFARETINDLVCKGGFPQLLINPINFDGLYEKKLADAKSQSAAQSSAAPN